MSYAALPTLRTPRLTLRPLEEIDADVVFDGVANYDVLRWLGRIPYPYERDHAVGFIERLHASDLPVWAIEAADGFVGVAGVEEELGYWLRRPAWGKGYGFEAAHAVIEHWFSDSTRGDLESGHYDDNDRSARILRALGFAERGKKLRFARALSQNVMGTDVVLTRKAWTERQDFTLRTDRLTIRPLAAHHAVAFAAATVPEVTRNMGRLQTGMTEEDVLTDLPRRTWRGYPNFTLALEQNGTFVGTVAFGGKPLSIAYFMAPGFDGQGLMTEALTAFIPELFHRFPMTTIHADHFKDNPASGTILRKLGFEETGREMGTSLARLEPAPLITYALHRDNVRVRP